MDDIDTTVPARNVRPIDDASAGPASMSPDMSDDVPSSPDISDELPMMSISEHGVLLSQRGSTGGMSEFMSVTEQGVSHQHNQSEPMPEPSERGSVRINAWPITQGVGASPEVPFSPERARDTLRNDLAAMEASISNVASTAIACHVATTLAMGELESGNVAITLVDSMQIDRQRQAINASLIGKAPPFKSPPMSSPFHPPTRSGLDVGSGSSSEGPNPWRDPTAAARFTQNWARDGSGSSNESDGSQVAHVGSSGPTHLDDEVPPGVVTSHIFTDADWLTPVDNTQSAEGGPADNTQSSDGGNTPRPNYYSRGRITEITIKHLDANTPQAQCVFCACHTGLICPRCKDYVCLFHAMWSRHRLICFPHNRTYTYMIPVPASIRSVDDPYDFNSAPYSCRMELAVAMGEDQFEWENRFYAEQTGLTWPTHTAGWYFLENVHWLNSNYSASSPLAMLVLSDVKVLHKCRNGYGQWHQNHPQVEWSRLLDTDEWLDYLGFTGGPDPAWSDESTQIEQCASKSDLITSYCGNIRILGWYGARMCQATLSPFDRVSAWPVDDMQRAQGIRNAVDLLRDGETLGMLIWGAPHRGTSSAVMSDRVGCQAGNAEIKTNAFESMMYQCPGIVLMTFPSRYKVEFSQPRHDVFLKGRGLLVERALCHNYLPRAGNPDEICAIAPGGEGPNPEECTMVAIGFHSKYFHCIHYTHSESGVSGVDLTRTYLSFLRALGPDEKAVVLGGYNFDLEGDVARYMEECTAVGCVNNRLRPWNPFPDGTREFDERLSPY